MEILKLCLCLWKYYWLVFFRKIEWVFQRSFQICCRTNTFKRYGQFNEKNYFFRRKKKTQKPNVFTSYTWESVKRNFSLHFRCKITVPGVCTLNTQQLFWIKIIFFGMAFGKCEQRTRFFIYNNGRRTGRKISWPGEVKYSHDSIIEKLSRPAVFERFYIRLPYSQRV